MLRSSPQSYIDGHCHLSDPRFAAELPRIIDEAEKRGIGVFVQGGVSPEDWERQALLKRRYPEKIVTCFGLHPWWVMDHSSEEFERAFSLLSGRIEQADAFGEIGLDHGPRAEESSFGLQQEAFERQLLLSKSLKKPLVLHVVRAHEAAIRTLEGAGIREMSGIVHSFTGSREIAKRYLDLGLSLSLSGVLTRKGFETLRRAVSYIPLDRLILETDSPDQKPADWVRSCNEPVALFEVARVVAELRSRGGQEATSSEALLEASAANLRRIFGQGLGKK